VTTVGALVAMPLGPLLGGLGLGLPLAAEAVLGTLPPHQTGMGNAVSRAVQSIVALGTAILGSVLNAGYRGALASHLTGLPGAASVAAAASVAGARGVAQRLPGQAGPALARAAGSAYVHGMVRGEAVGIGVLLAGAVMCLLLLPGRDQERSA